MNDFARLIENVDKTNKTNDKVLALENYFKTASNEDKVWAIALFSSKRPKRAINSSKLREYAAELANIPLWLFEESYHIVGDLAETISLIVPNSENKMSCKNLSQYICEINNLKNLDEDSQKQYLFDCWLSMDYYSRFVFNKIITGGFRIGVSQKLMTRSLANVTGIDKDTIAYQIMGDWSPDNITFDELILSPSKDSFFYKPFPFYLAYALDVNLNQLGDPNDWVYENKWDGIRAQLIKRNNQISLWSRSGELISNQFPEIIQMGIDLPNGTVIDGELLVFKDNNIGSFNDLQKRLGRKKVGKIILEKYPVVLKAYDLLENKQKDIRSQAYHQRRSMLHFLVNEIDNVSLQLSLFYNIQNWSDLEIAHQKARENRSEGLMIKQKKESYKVGRKKGDWWKWKVDPLTIDAVLTYAMRGHGRRANLFTDYTFALWKKNENGKKSLITFAKAYSGLNDKEFKEIDSFIKKNTLEKFGPVRSVKPYLVFEIAFEGVFYSSRHKSGVSVRFPRISRWRKDKKIDDANDLTMLKDLING
tara:strand:- start:9874 stop:11475 length:1602 start_codon:yes stop_codon:yes gene_type:complete